MDEMTVRALADNYFSNLRPTGIVITEDVVLAQAIKATRYYEGFGGLELFDDRVNLIDEDTPLTKSELAVISPLFELYVERENALILEASRALGVEVYGRTVSEINNDIVQKEQEIQHLAFQFDIITI
ncbi:hypothetical protein [Rodentibacter pneumotropicus]|uniref:Uncharacterized protein n=2 Tax=Rodentibacter pneumotropicus TaxID=758 RepID=A0A4S2PPC0_9PAST|nr:hypothetical protein [Rodentibacter pneumotropicus]THA05528.1 hypothetical protein D3M77_09400 [Rodentibacter pneumotropicus]THA16336.1 hypothetical protein D3M76_03460 [Rodentibacter pneumotropicus]